jgi:hypothetical protein
MEVIMAANKGSSKDKLPALSELVGEIEDRGNGLAVWHRTWSKNGKTEPIMICTTAYAEDLHNVSAQTLTNWVKDGLFDGQVAYGWWDLKKLVQWVCYVKDHRKRKERFD